MLTLTPLLFQSRSARLPLVQGVVLNIRETGKQQHPQDQVLWLMYNLLLLPHSLGCGTRRVPTTFN